MLIQLSIGLSWMSFLIQIIACLVLGMTNGFQLYPGYFSHCYKTLNHRMILSSILAGSQLPCLGLVYKFSTTFRGFNSNEFPFLSPYNAVLVCFIFLVLLGAPSQYLLMLSAGTKGTSQGHWQSLDNLEGEGIRNCWTRGSFCHGVEGRDTNNCYCYRCLQIRLPSGPVCGAEAGIAWPLLLLLLFADQMTEA